MTLLFVSTPERAKVWERSFAEAGEAIVIGEDAVKDPEAITHLACWLPPGDLGRYPNLRALICVGAGVDHMPPLPSDIVLVRTVAPGIEEMVRDWAVMAALMLHREMPHYLAQAAEGSWSPRPAQLPRHRHIGVMGLGRTGRLTAQGLANLGFRVAGWSRSGTPVKGVEVFDKAGLAAFLERTDLLICLLPLTPDTRGVLNDALFRQLPAGAALVHAGRGAHLDMAALRAALDDGQLSTAMLDVTDPEPVPHDHWAWSDPRVIVTPHIAAHTDAAEGARHALEVIRADRTGAPIPGLVDPSRGY